MRNTLYIFCLFLLLSCPMMAADATWNLQFTAATTPDWAFDGKLTTTDYVIMGVTGTYAGAPVSLLPSGTFGDNDNLLRSSAPWFTVGGLGFSAPGMGYFNLWWNADDSEYILAGPDGDMELSSFSLTPDTATPEPSAIALLAGGLGLIGWRLRRRA